MHHLPPARGYFPGMGKAVADRTINRMIERNGVKVRETWADVASRVAIGNALLDPRTKTNPGVFNDERERLEHHLRQASLLMSGRHLQHGDENQPSRNMEVFTNCSTAAVSFLLFYLLLNGSGVGRAYDDDLLVTDWSRMPRVVCTIDYSHPDVASGEITGFMTRRDAEHLFMNDEVTVFEVPDSREGWQQAIELIERMAFEGRHDEVLILEFTKVRHRNSPINGMQGRPASGPGPLMQAINNIARLRGSEMDVWRQTMFVDHYLAECVLVGGARRAARMATKSWRDATIFGFINLKRGGFLWSSNNSVTIDEEFRERVTKVLQAIKTNHGVVPVESVNAGMLSALKQAGLIDHMDWHAFRVLVELAKAAYFDGTGEPGLINQDRLTQKNDGVEGYLDGLYAESAKLKLMDETLGMMRAIAKRVCELRYTMITNPCGEIALLILGGYCVIADVVPFHAADDDDAEDAFRTATRALIRTNLMDSLYSREVKRTNRIGVGITGLHEWIYSRFGFTWKDIVDETKSREMWLTLSRFKRAVVDEAATFSNMIGVVAPHTDTTFKPAGTTSKLFGLTEGAHLPSMREFLRWVQFRNDDPLVQDYAARGYPMRKLTSYSGTTIVGFPTRPTICELDGGEWIVTAAEATPEEQYEYLRLIEKYWIRGVAEDGVTPLAETGNQVSYTLKYDPKAVSFDDFFRTLVDGQFSIRCCSVMPQTDTTAYEYQPEEPITREDYDRLISQIQMAEKEDIGFEHVDCGAGGCPIDFTEGEQAEVANDNAQELPERFELSAAGYHVFGQANCPWCEAAVNELRKAGLPYQYVEMTDSEKQDMRRLYPSMTTVPIVIWVNGDQQELVGGYTELVAKLAA